MSSKTEASPCPKPFLRWAGGKRKLVPEILKSFPLAFDGKVNRFYEPFVGGGSLMLALGNPTANFYVPGNKLHINDANPDLISVYLTLRDNPMQLIKALRKLEDHVNKSDYEEMRSLKPKSELQRAVRFIYLNKTCFNGLWRVNSKGEFNVPWGKIKKPALLDEDNFLRVSSRLKKARITNLDFTKAIKNVGAGDLVYFDPPYIPLTPTASFSAYAKDGFGQEDQEKLAETIKELTSIGAYVILSNSDTPMTRKIYGKSLRFRTIDVQRSISANSNGRIKVTEIIGTNERFVK